ncbi:chromo domain-containing protein [Purpureocillium lavendulum]|uniref:Chromo domain-containing protein n=1 Tax=Purpureocillium lavendulum TaxID=1247861 RepID=A0AB34FN49_9HYPO|nr:chromo domain-containing protein [Purpureocillium lavendulum]
MATSTQFSTDQEMKDDVSITSTIDEMHDSEEEFTVTRLLAERSLKNRTHYLVDWEGWPLDEATWEPEEAFSAETIAEWEATKRSTGTKTAVGFRLRDWEDAVRESIRQKRARHDRRNLKRLAQGLETTDFSDEREELLMAVCKSIDDDTDPDDDGSHADQPAVRHEAVTDVDDDMTVLDTLRSSSHDRRQQSIAQKTSMDASPLGPKYISSLAAVGPKSASTRTETASCPAGAERSLTAKLFAASGKPNKPSAPTSIGISGTKPETQRNSAVNNSRSNAAQPGPSSQMHGSLSTRIPPSRPDLSAKSPRETVNVFVGGKVGKRRRKLSEVVLDPTKEPRLLKARHQNLAQKQLRDNEGTRAPNFPLPFRRNPSPTSRRNSAPDASHLSANAHKEVAQEAGGSVRRSSMGSNLLLRSGVDEEDLKEKAVDSRQGQRNLQKKGRTVRFGDPPEVEDYEVPAENESLFVEQDIAMLDLDQEGTGIIPERIAPMDNSSSTDPSPNNSLSTVRKSCRFGSDTAQPLVVDFIGVPSDETQNPWAAHFRHQDQLVFTHSCTARDFLHSESSRSDELCRGHAVGVSDPRQLHRVSTHVESGALALLCHSGEYYILVFSLKSDEWSTLRNSEALTGDAALNFVLFRSAPLFHQTMLAPVAFMPIEQVAVSEPRAHERIPMFDLVFGSMLDKLLPPVSQRPQNVSFFLAFPPSAEQEALLMVQWLQLAIPGCEIKSSMKPGDWSAFIAPKHGVVVIHEKVFWAIRSFPHISDILHASKSNFSFWLFRRPLLSMERFSQPDPALSEVSAELCPILRPGTAILVTPSFLVSQPEQAYNFFKWCFQIFSHTSQSYYPGNLAVCADFEDFVLDLAMEKAETYSRRQKPSRHVAERDIEARMKTWRLVRELLAESSEGGDSRVVLAPDTIDGNDEQSLVNWFGWWTMTHMDQLRKFSVLGSSYQRPERMTRLIRPGRFEFQVQNQRRQARDDVPEKPPPLRLIYSDDGVAIRDFLFNLNEQARSTAFCPVAVYTYPVSYWHGDMAFHFGDYNSDFDSYSNWFKVLGDFLGSPEAKGRVNTFSGLFYTIEASWRANDARPEKGRAAHRRPWAVVYRPVDLHRKPWKSMELLIWDYTAKHKTSSDAVRLTDLIDAQQELVQMVKNQSVEKDLLPLSRVWLGSTLAGELRSGLMHSLDITLDWLSKVCGDTKNWMPLPAAILKAQGWKQVSAAETQMDPAPQHLMPTEAMAVDIVNGDASDDEGEAAATTTIFQPPSGAGRHSENGSKNLLYAWAEAKLKTGQRGKSEYTFQPTMQWYQEQLRDGRGFHHIQVSSWEPLFERYAIVDPKRAQAAAFGNSEEGNRAADA